MSTSASFKEKMAILVIDDEPDFNEVFVDMLKRNSYKNVTDVGSGEEAIAYFKENPVDIAFIDLDLPDINGIDLIGKLRAINPDTEFIIITGFGSLDYAIKAMQMDVGAFLEKPISADKFVRTLEEVMIKYQLKIENQQFLFDIEKANKEILFLNDLLVNNVDDLNQSLLLTMVQIEKLNPTEEQKKVLRLFQQSIRKNARLTRNIRKLELVNSKTEASLKKIELSSTLNNVINRLRNDYSDKNFEIIGEITEERHVRADNDLLHLLSELFLISILNDPSPNIKINLEFSHTVREETNYLKINVKAFQVKHVYDQKDIADPSDLKTKVSEQSFQDLGPFIINSLLRLYNGYVELPDDETNNLIDLYIPKSDK
ncbi:MAG: response regulator [Asgard group archaeon]|nr:response regulator [Asgard group archaeon]